MLIFWYKHTLSPFSLGFDLWTMSRTGSSAYYWVADATPPLRNSKTTMFMLSTPPTTTFFVTPTPRVPFLSSSKPSSVSLLRSSTASYSPCCSSSSSITPKVKSNDNNNCYLVSAKHSPANTSASVSSRTFLNAKNEQGSLHFSLSLSSLSSHLASLVSLSWTSSIFFPYEICSLRLGSIFLFLIVFV